MMDLSVYKNIPYTRRENCMVCGSPLSSALIDFPEMPMTEIYVDSIQKDKLGVLDQSLFFCDKCKHAQLGRVIDISLQYSDSATYAFRTSQSTTGRQTTDFFIDFFNKIMGNKKTGTIVEVGCNDFFLLSKLKDKADKLIGIDPVLKGLKVDLPGNKIVLIPDFFENVHLDGNIDIVICKDVLEHVSEPRTMLENLLSKTRRDTFFFIQVPLLDTILSGRRFDQVFHQHLNYFSVNSFNYMLEQLDCELIDYCVNYEHWGAGLFAFRRKSSSGKAVLQTGVAEIKRERILESYDLFKKLMAATKEILLFHEGETIYGYGASLMLALLAYYLKSDLSCLKSVIDDDMKKNGKYYLQLPVPIKHSSEIKDIDSSIIFLTAISSRINVKNILKRLFDANVRTIIYPLQEI